MYFDNLKKNQQNQGGKNWCYIEYFMSLIISNFRTTASCFETIKLGISFEWDSNKNGTQAHKDIFKFSKINFW